ncbi:unnamed protein product, partial [Prorocentrum cordatum]
APSGPPPVLEVVHRWADQGQPQAPEALGAIVALRADIAGLRAEFSAVGERPVQAGAAAVEAPRSEVQQHADEVDEASEGGRQKPRRPEACQVRGAAAAKPFASPTRIEALAEEADCDGEGSPTAFLASQVKGGAGECECYVLDPLRDFVAAGDGQRSGQPFARRRAQDGEDVKDELDVMTSVSQPACCTLTGKPLTELVVEGVGGKTGVVPLAVDGVDVTARLGSELESHCHGESKLKGLDAKKDFGYCQPLRGHCDFDDKLEGIDALHDVDHGRHLHGDGVDRSECEGKLEGAGVLKDALNDVGYVGPLRGEGVGHGECEVKQEGIDVMKDVDRGGLLRGEGVGHCECEGKLEGSVLRDVDRGGPLRGAGVGHVECVKLEGLDAVERRLVSIDKKGRPRGKAAQAAELAAGLPTADDALEAQLAAARADLAIEEIEVRLAAVELAAAGGA